MEAVECTHCQVAMTSWSPAGGAVRYFQCPLCGRTHSSFYDEVFRARAGARLTGVAAYQASPAALPMASREDRDWATIRARAARWFTRLESEERRLAGAHAPAATPQPAAPEVAPATARPLRHR